MNPLEIRKAHPLRRLTLAAAMTVWMIHPACAATLKTESTILHDRITLGDVFDGVTENADYYLAPAPAMGKSVTLNAQDLARISAAFNLGWVAEGNFQQAVIRRSSSAIDRLDIQAALQQRLAADMKGRKFEMELSDRAVSFHVPEGADQEVKIDNLTYDAAKGLFSAVVSPMALPEMRREVGGRFYQITRMPVLNAPLRPGDIISAADIDYIDMRAPDISPSMVADAEKLIGQTPRRGMTAMRPITAGDVQLPVVVKKGDVVTMLLQSGGISLTAQGRALDNGAEGDVVRIMNTSSKQVVDAVVTGAQTVSITPPSMKTL